MKITIEFTERNISEINAVSKELSDSEGQEFPETYEQVLKFGDVSIKDKTIVMNFKEQFVTDLLNLIGISFKSFRYIIDALATPFKKFINDWNESGNAELIEKGFKYKFNIITHGKKEAYLARTRKECFDLIDSHYSSIESIYRIHADGNDDLVTMGILKMYFESKED